jgi:hypothetical protein
MMTVKEIVEQVGSDKLECACGVTEFSVKAAKRERMFPASWFKVVEKLCNEKGIECPDNLFNFKRAAQ